MIGYGLTNNGSCEPLTAPFKIDKFPALFVARV